MSGKRTPEQRARHLEGLRQFAIAQRQVADETCRRWAVDDPLHPLMPTGEAQVFQDWKDFLDRVARPLVETEGDEDAIQCAMRLYRQASPYFICVAMVMMANRIDRHPS